MSKPANKKEPCKLNDKEKDTSSKIVVWCVRCPPRTAWQGHRRVAQHSPRFATQPHHIPPHHRDSYTTLTPAGMQASQAKPHQKHTQHKTTPQSRRHLPPRAASPILQQCLDPTALLPNSTFKRFTYIEKCFYFSQQHLLCHALIVSKPRIKRVACWENASLATFHLPFCSSLFPSDPGLTALLPKNTSK